MPIGNVFKAGKEPDASNLAGRAIVVRMAQELGVGQYASRPCPACEGGATHERSMSLSVEQSGVIKFHCHRSACDFQGQAYASPGLAPHREGDLILAGANTNPLTSDLHKLSDREVEWFKTRFNLQSVAAIRRTPARYALPILSPGGSTRGWITRRPWDGSPGDTQENRNDNQWSLKALTYFETDDIALSWYHAPSDRDTHLGVILVEDQISAMRLAEWIQRSDDSLTGTVVALLGTGLNASKVAEIQREARSHTVTFALDKDATGQAFAMARKWGQAFNQCRVVVLSKDIKDSTDGEIAELPF